MCVKLRNVCVGVEGRGGGDNVCEEMRVYTCVRQKMCVGGEEMCVGLCVWRVTMSVCVRVWVGWGDDELFVFGGGGETHLCTQPDTQYFDKF